eukprot:scaffold69213_cov32-Tisochrysis_lutea.AAC.1
MGATMRRHGHGLIHIPYAHEIKCDGMSTAFMRLTAHFEFFSVDRLNMIFHMSKIKNTMSTMLPITIAAPPLLSPDYTRCARSAPGESTR